LPLHQLLRDKAFDEPDRVAIVFGDRRLTFADLDTESNQLAHGLRASDFREETGSLSSP
jgi:non-ribosomal peptide synthetase component E (peptide arylation enzyme)